MAAVIQSPADIVNLALRQIGYKLRVANLYDGSEAASQALDIYGQARDDLLRDGEWQFCERNVNATQLKVAPAAGYFATTWNPTDYPPYPWTYSYDWPSDCLKVRMIKPQPNFLLDMTPRPTLWAIVNDNGYATPKRVIVGNIQNPILVYAGQVTNPADWPVDFIEALAASLGRKLVAGLMGLNALQPAAQEEANAVRAAAQEQG